VIAAQSGIVVTSTSSTGRTSANNDQLIESAELLGRLVDLRSSLKDTESAQRGYLIAGDGGFLEACHTAAAQTEVAMLKLEELATRAKVLIPRIQLLKQYVDEKLAEMKSTISTRQEKGPEAAAAILRRGRWSPNWRPPNEKGSPFEPRKRQQASGRPPAHSSEQPRWLSSP
jgi:CHASE3 domain sensor protein